ncbi:hypothetical protein V495_02896 [Pseudogymnoascus sp. VKM F-4514 (FW-929)]|nr:hypothetical protein V495_02896 [Pseudogymnoascus sp. VKM F-4514 (FW-929)]KFY53956.1 hypothetical protein V497_08105 [Pseudogymnoascus sp. VKM F-4516 (FW-969)]
MVRSTLERKLSASSSASSTSTLSDTDCYERFTATGRPMPAYNRSAWSSACIYGPTAPHFLPFRFTDDSIIPVVVRVCEENFKAGVEGTHSKRRRSLRDRLHLRSNKSKIVVAMMPRRDYLRHFAHDEEGRYVGTEKEESWSEGDLEEEFGEYKLMEPRKWVVRGSGSKAYMEEE